MSRADSQFRDDRAAVVGKMTKLLAIDQSTSSTKVLLFDAMGHVHDSVCKPHLAHHPQPGWVEQDAEEIWRNVQGGIAELIERNPKCAIAGVTIANQRETFVVMDRKSGLPLHRAIVWQCRRGADICRALPQAELIVKRTGLVADTYFSGSKILWLVRNRPDIAHRLANGSAVIATMDAFLVHRLTRGDTFATDVTNASRTLLYDIRRLRWDQELCAMFEVPELALPEVRESASSFGSTSIGGLGEVPIVGVMGDSQASLFAQRCFHRGSTKATFGTGTSILRNTGEKVPVTRNGSVAALAWVRNGRPTYAAEGIINYCAATIEWLRSSLGIITRAEDSDEMARSLQDNAGVYCVPAFVGLSAPHWAPDARAAFVGITPGCGRAHFVRAALEAVAYQIQDILVEQECSRIHADGKPASNRFLMQFVADITRKELLVADVPETSAWGAAMAGLLTLGVYKTEADLEAIPQLTKMYRPQMAEVEAQRLYAGWEQAVRRVLL